MKNIYDKFKVVCDEKGFSLIEDHEYLSNIDKHPVRCSCGNVWDIDLSNLRACKGCPECKAAKHRERAIQGLTKKIDGEEFSKRLSAVRDDVILVGTYSKASEKTLFQCTVCGNHWLVRPHHIMSGSRCPECNKRHYDNAKIDERLTGKFENIVRVSNYVLGGDAEFYCKECSGTFSMRPNILFARKNKKLVCPSCVEKFGRKGGFDTTREGSLYFATVVVNGRLLYKVGITNGDPEKRLSDIAEKFIVYRTLRLHGTHVANMEAYIKAKFKHLRAFKNGDVVDCKSGYTEMYTDDITKMLTKEELILAAKGLTSVQQNVKETQEVVK